MKKLIVLFFAMMVFSTAGYAQVSPSDDPILKTCEEAVDKSKRLELENQSLKIQLQLETERRLNAQEDAKNAKEQAAFWKEAAKKGDQIDTGSALVIEQLRIQVNEYRAENDRLQRENDSLRSSRNWRTVLGFGAGFATGYFTKKTN